MLNDKQLEAAARELCRLRRQDPDKTIWHGASPDESGCVPAVAICSQAWQLVAREIDAHEQLQAAIDFGRRA